MPKDKQGILDNIFPELKENENEKIRKCISDVIIEHDWSHIYGVTKDDCLSWLEKQDEHKSFNYENANIQQKDFAVKNEQNPVCSEDDENRFKNLIYLVENSNETKGTKEGFIKFINRLKLLKEKND